METKGLAPKQSVAMLPVAMVMTSGTAWGLFAFRRVDWFRFKQVELIHWFPQMGAGHTAWQPIFCMAVPVVTLHKDSLPQTNDVLNLEVEEREGEGKGEKGSREKGRECIGEFDKGSEGTGQERKRYKYYKHPYL